MERNVCQVVFGRTVVVKEAPGFRALIRRSTSQTCGPDKATGRHATHNRQTKIILALLDAILLLSSQMSTRQGRTLCALVYGLIIMCTFHLGPDPDPACLSAQLKFLSAVADILVDPVSDDPAFAH